MSEQTPLDMAHAAMEATPENDSARMRFYENLADCELFLLLAEDPQGDNITPEVFDVSDNSFVLAFDKEERLATFVGKPAPYAALSGRALAGMLAGQGIGLGVNLEVAPSSILLPPEAMAWLTDTLAPGPEETMARALEIRAPGGVSEALLGALQTKLAQAAGLAKGGYLVEITYEDGAEGLFLGVVDAAPRVHEPLARSVNEALVFSGEDTRLDVGFFDLADQEVIRLEKVGLWYEIPQPVAPQEAVRPAPGSDPAKPPILK
ncbi:MAG: hypothetical protein CSA70_05600 [Rhodobacterales bacterium]|nr:MAG: hypothetical protein CSA70_05600 [Rhodobacterales bacterium]